MRYSRYHKELKSTGRLPVRTKASLYTLRIIREKLQQINEKKRNKEDTKLILELEGKFKLMERCFLDKAKGHESIIYDSGKIFYNADSMAWYYFCMSAYIREGRSVSYDHEHLIPTFRYKKDNIYFQYVPYSVHDMDRKEIYSNIPMTKNKLNYTVILVNGRPAYRKYFALVRYEGVTREMLVHLGSFRELLPEVVFHKGKYHMDPSENRMAIAKKFPDFAEAIDFVNKLTYVNSTPLYDK